MNMNEVAPLSLEYLEDIAAYEEERMVTRRAIELMISNADSQNLAALLVEIDEDLPAYTGRHEEYGDSLTLTPLQVSEDARRLWTDLRYQRSGEPLINKVITIRIQPLDVRRTRVLFTCIEHAMIATQHYERFVELIEPFLKLFPDAEIISCSANAKQEDSNTRYQQLDVDTQSKRRLNASTVRKLKALSELREKERSNGKILTGKLDAAKKLKIDRKTVIRHEPQLWEKWDEPDYVHTLEQPTHIYPNIST
jgi:hypothetical protein